MLRTKPVATSVQRQLNQRLVKPPARVESNISQISDRVGTQKLFGPENYPPIRFVSLCRPLPI